MILVTGGTGFAGSYILFELLRKKGNTVRALKRPASSTRQTEYIFRHLCATENIEDDLFNLIEWVDGDLLDVISLREALAGVEEVYHCAAVVSFSSKHRNELLRTNVEGTKNLVNLCIEMGILRLGYVSSVAALKHNGKAFIDETMPSGEPEFSSIYSQSKFYGEMEVWRGIAEGLNSVIVNPTVILGWGDFEKSSLKIFSTIKKGLPLYPTGINGYVDARDVARAFVSLMQRPEAFGKRYILNSANLSYKDLFDKIAISLHAKPPRWRSGKALAYIYSFIAGVVAVLSGRENMVTREIVHNSFQDYRYDNSLITNTINYQFIGIDQTIRDACGVYLNNVFKS